MIWRRLVFLIYFFTILCAGEEKPIVVIVTSYNNREWYEKNLDSVRIQNYSNYHVFYIDDCSTDETANAVQAYIERWQLQDTITLLRNPVRRGQLYNIYVAVHCCPNNVIITTLDGDDFFSHENVLSVVNKAYDNPNVWLTYGQFIEYPKGTVGFCKKIPDLIKKHNAYRYYDWVTSHLRTFYAGLFKQIPIGYFIKEGDFIRCACDHAFMFPLLELSAGRVAFIEEVLYLYNIANSNSVFRKKPIQQLINAYWSRGRKPLDPLNNHPTIDLWSVSPVFCNIHFSFGSIQSCAKYLDSISIAEIDSANVTIFYDAHSQEIKKAYRGLCASYGVEGIMIDTTVNCKEQLLSYLGTISADEMVLLTCDGCVWQDVCDVLSASKMIEHTKAKGYSYSNAFYSVCGGECVVNRNIPCCVPLYNNFYVWKYAEAWGLWHTPYSAQAVLYPLTTINTVIGLINGCSVLELTQALALIPAAHGDEVGVCNAYAACCYTPVKMCIKMPESH